MVVVMLAAIWRLHEARTRAADPHVVSGAVESNDDYRVAKVPALAGVDGCCAEGVLAAPYQPEPV
jgi:hypothetical protein